ncbi:MAG TPA: hypothetical protein VGG48_06030 [Rhizomicrobium sp.]|jgi:hypothetical protein
MTTLTPRQILNAFDESLKDAAKVAQRRAASVKLASKKSPSVRAKKKKKSR